MASTRVTNQDEHFTKLSSFGIVEILGPSISTAANPSLSRRGEGGVGIAINASGGAWGVSDGIRELSNPVH
jgi:hypothetical protein